MRRDVVDDPHAGGFQLRHRVRRRRFDQIDLARQQRIGARQCFRHRDQDQLVGLRNPLLVPVVRVLGEFGEFARHQFCQFERSGAGGLAGELVPILAELFILRGAGDQEPEHLVGEEGIDGLGGDFDGVVVDLGVARDRRQAGLHLRALALVELRRLVVQHLVEIPDHRVGIEVAAVMEFDALAQVKRHLVLSLSSTFHSVARPGTSLPGRSDDVHFPGNQRIVDRIGGELIGAGAAIRLAGGQRDVGHRNAVAHHGFRPAQEWRAGRRRWRAPRRREASNFGCA